MNTYIQESALFFQMAQSAIRTESSPDSSGADPCEKLQAEHLATISTFTISLEGKGLADGGKEVGWIEYRRFSMEGYCLNGNKFSVWGEVGRIVGSPMWGWGEIGLKLKLEGFVHTRLRHKERDIRGQLNLSKDHIYVGSLMPGCPNHLVVETTGDTNLKKWAIKSYLLEKWIAEESYKSDRRE